MAGLTKIQTALAAIKYDIKSLDPGEKLLGIRAAGLRYGVSANVVNIAYQKLESEGLVDVLPYGTFVK